MSKSAIFDSVKVFVETVESYGYNVHGITIDFDSLSGLVDLKFSPLNPVEFISYNHIITRDFEV